MNQITLIFLLVVIAGAVNAQPRIIFGKVTNSAREGVSGANVLLKRAGNGSIAFFKITRSDGEYRFVLADTITTSDYYLEVTHLTYEQATAELVDGQSEYNFTLFARVNKIPQINVGTRPRITQEGDTLRYDVQSFAETMDRSIGDVLKRMPGVEVADNGRITFQGQAISNLYIDGDDLLEDKYGIGTKAIPHVMVKGVEVLKNHQPIKVLKDRVVSRDIAINLVIRDEAKLKLSGDMKLGGGLPEQYFAEINTMLFNKKHKLLNILKGNNTGVDLQADMADLVRSAPSTKRLLSTGTTGDPSLPKSRYYLNNSGGIFTNNLVNLPSEWQLKSNIDFFIDRSRMDYTSRSTVFTATDSILFDEGLHRIREPRQLDINLRANKNVDSKYLNNDLKLTYRGDGTSASLLSNAVGMQQSLSQREWRFSNAFRYVPLLHNGHVLNIDWTVNGHDLPEFLDIVPGSAVSFIDTSGNASSLTQQTELQALATHINLEYMLKPTWIRQRYSASLSQDWQSLGSSIRLDDGGNNGSQHAWRNDLRWRKTAARAAGFYYYEQRSLKMGLSLPVSLQRIAYRDGRQGLDRSQANFLFTPMFYTVVSLGGSNEVEARYSRSNTFGDLTTVYGGAILTNYRTLVTNDGVLQERHGDNISLKYTGGNPVSMFFFNAGYTYSAIVANTITAVEMTDRESRLIQLPYKNTAVNHQLHTEISKFIFFLGAKSGLRASWRTGEQDQLINGDLLPYRSRLFSLEPDFNVKLFKKVQLAYQGHLTWYRNEPAGAAVDFYQRLFTAGHTMHLTYSPNSVTHMGASGQHLLTTQRGNPDRNYFFADAYARYKVVKWRTEFELNLTNIADVQRFGYVMLDANASHESSYDIRGRMLLLKALFNF